MNVNRNIIDSLRYPLKGLVKLIVLGIILIIPVVNFIGLGYYLRIIKSTSTGSDELPGFEGVGDLFTDGIKFLAVCMIYGAVPLLFYALSFAFPGSATLPLIATGFALIISIFAYMGMANMAYHGSKIGAALKYGEILKRITAIGWGSYILWWIVLTLIVIVAGFIIGVVGGVLLFFVLGLPVVLLGYGYLMIFQARSIALTFAS